MSGKNAFTYASLCDGIGAVHVAWQPLGWRCAWTSEIEPFPSAVVDARWGLPNVGDMRDLIGVDAAGELCWAGPSQRIDLLVGGTPCQAFSVAGLRRSLSDARGNLSLVFCTVADMLDPAVVLWENVPGVLSTSDNAFGCFLAGLAGESDALIPPGGRWSNAGYVSGPARNIAWRLLDAQHFGLAQRRLRLFVVACPRNGADPREVLFDPKGVHGDYSPRRQTGSKPSGRARGRSGWRGVWRSLAAAARRFSSPRATRCDRPVPLNPLSWGAARSLTSSTGGVCAKEQQHTFVGDRPAAPDGAFQPDGIAHAVNGDGSKFGSGRDGQDTFIGIPCSVVGPLCSHSSDHGHAMTTQQAAVAFQCHGSNVGPMGTLRNGNGNETGGVPFVPVAFSSKDYGADAGELAPTLRSGNHAESHANAGAPPAVVYGFDPRQDPNSTQNLSEPLDAGIPPKAVAFQTRIARNGRGAPEEICPTLQGAGAGATSDMRPCVAVKHDKEPKAAVDISPTLQSADGGSGCVSVACDSVEAAPLYGGFTAYAVRRLTPRECERLQGFPDDYTAIEYRWKPAADGPRYRALGNSMAVPVMRWIGQRIAAVSAILDGQRKEEP